MTFIIKWVKVGLVFLGVIFLVRYLIGAIANNSYTFESNSSYNLEPYKTNYSGGISLSPSNGVANSSGRSWFSFGSRTNNNYPPQTDNANRLLIKESSLSLLVANVVETRKKIISYAQSIGGYMVSANTTNPDNQAFAEVVVRVPAEKLEEAINTCRLLGIKVVSENLYGYDVTDQYVDIEKRISQHEKTLQVYEELLNRATQVSDISNITKQILSTQEQIDSLKGQQYALEQNSKLAKLTIYLSTDEIALPYTPDEAFRPQVIFKNAVRSMIGSLRIIAAFIIWAGVYAVIWVPSLLIFVFGRKVWQNKFKAK